MFAVVCTLLSFFFAAPTLPSAAEDSVYIAIDGVSSLRVYDRAGSFVSNNVNDPGAVASLPDVVVDAAGDESWSLVLPIHKAYRLRIVTGQMPAAISVLTGESNINPRAATRYNDLEVLEHHVAELAIGADESVSLRYDGHAKGVFDTLLKPLASVSGPLAGDIVPPRITISGSSRVTIAADDDGVDPDVKEPRMKSGVSVIYYVTNGKLHKVAEPKVILDARPGEEILAFADDRAGNRCSVRQYTVPAK